jgi:formylglycine-generating enzyme required for sulfatase activity
MGDGAANYDEHPARDIEITGFWMDATEVTNGEYRRCVDAGACSPPIRQEEFADDEFVEHPVVWVTWFQAANYARWAGKRLPTEAEWERAARAGSEDRYPWGHEFQPWKVNGVGSEGGDPFPFSAPVGSYPANRWGLVDLLGNVAEWTADRYHRNYWNAPRDGRAWNQLTGEWVEPRRVVRGGSFTGSASALRVSQRGQRAPESGARNVGFRCVAE